MIIGIRGAGHMNKGAEAMLMSTMNQMSQRLDVNFAVSESAPFGIKVNAVLDISGFAYSDRPRWSKGAFADALKCRNAQANAKWYFLPQTLGPFAKSREVAQRLFQGTVVYARDDKSMASIGELETCREVRNCTDITWGFEPDVERGRDTLHIAGIDLDKPVIGISPNIRVQECDSNYVKKLRRLIGIAKEMAQVIVIPHEIKKGRPDDIELVKQLDAPGIMVDIDAKCLKGVISHLSLLIGSRYHALLGALSSGIPVLSIGWAHKYKALTTEVGLELQMLDNIEENYFREKVEAAWANRSEISSHIAEISNAKRTEVRNMFDRIAGELGTSTDLLKVHSAVKYGIEKNKKRADNYFNFRRNIHRLEKGLIARNHHSSQRLFGSDYIEETIGFLRASLDTDSWDEKTLSWGCNVLDLYFDLFPSSRWKNTFELVSSRVDGWKGNEGFSPYPAKNRKEVEIEFDDFKCLANHRRSVRYYLDKIPPPDAINECLELGMQAPSACNRQAFRFFHIRDPNNVHAWTSIPYGARDLTVPNLIVVIAKYEGYFDSRDVKCPIIDASLASMLFLLALETKGLASLCINFPDVPEFDRCARKLTKLAEDELVVMLIGVGYPDPEGGIPSSPKRSPFG